MSKIDRMCKELNTTEEDMVDIIVSNNFPGAISEDYIRRIAEKCVKFVIQDVWECADRESWNTDDVRLAFGRAICHYLHIEY